MTAQQKPPKPRTVKRERLILAGDVTFGSELRFSGTSGPVRVTNVERTAGKIVVHTSGALAPRTFWPDDQLLVIDHIEPTA